MQLSNLLLLAVAVATSLVADSIPSGQGKIQLQNGTHVYGCLDTNAMFTIDTSQCVTLTADGSTGVISWANGFDTVYLGIPDAYPQPLLFFNSASQAINWTFAANSQLPGLLYVPSFGEGFQLWSSTMMPVQGTDQVLFAAVGLPEGPGDPESAFFVWVS